MKLINFLFGVRPSSSVGSNIRRAVSRLEMLIIFAIAIILAFGSLTSGESIAQSLLVWLFVANSTLFFAFVVLVIPFLTGTHFQPNPSRLFFDGLISVFLTVLTFAYCYRVYGIRPPTGDVVGRFDTLYFSAVTFSTLGYGDFSPAPATRLWASAQAIIGNLHLGVIVGAAFFAAQNLTTNVSGDTNGKGEDGSDDSDPSNA